MDGEFSKSFCTAESIDHLQIIWKPPKKLYNNCTIHFWEKEEIKDVLNFVLLRWQINKGNVMLLFFMPFYGLYWLKYDKVCFNLTIPTSAMIFFSNLILIDGLRYAWMQITQQIIPNSWRGWFKKKRQLKRLVLYQEVTCNQTCVVVTTWKRLLCSICSLLFV